MKTINATPLNYAIANSKRGWRVFPVHRPLFDVCSCGDEKCGNVGKHPRTERGCNDATTDLATIKAWWSKWPDASIGLATGAGSGLFVLDVDIDKGGADSLDALCQKHGNLPTTVTVSTGGGGLHLYFLHPGRKVKTTNNQLGPGLDVRGDGGYVVAPPSDHISGNCYTFEPGLSPKDTIVADAPAWLLQLVCEPERKTDRPAPVIQTDIATIILGKALAKVSEGNRNDTGIWLAVQLRDNGVSQPEAERILANYCARCPQGGKAYTEREAIASVRSAYSRPPREPWTAKEASVESKVVATPKASQDCAGDELKAYLQQIIDEEIYAVELPWHYLTVLTQALIPSSVLVVCGDPGIGKTFWTLQNLAFWKGNDVNAEVFFVEKDRRFHTHRILAQLEKCGNFCDFNWIRDNGKEVMAAEARHHEMISFLGKHIHSETESRVNTRSLITWMQQKLEAGARVLVVDPITMVDGGRERYLADDQFMFEAQRLVTKHGASLVLITHPKKGSKTHGMGEMAMGAAYERFCDTGIWLTRSAKPKRLRVRVNEFVEANITADLFASMFKTRNGRGAGCMIAYTFERLLFAEQGLVLGEIKKDESHEDD